MKSHLIKDQIISNDFNTTFHHPKTQSKSFENSQDTSQKNPFQSSQKKSNKIKQTKMLLAQKLKQVTKFEQLPQTRQNIINDGKAEHLLKIENLESHFNPISKLTKQPFVRSKTCEQMRKQFSLKRQRKRNNSASKYSTPNTDISERHVQSTGMNSSNKYYDQNTSSKKPNLKLDMKRNNASKIETKQFTLDPFIFDSHMIETFNKQKIEKLSQQDPHKNKMKSKVTFAKMSKDSKQIVDLPNQINFPFKINTIKKRNQSEQIRSPLLLQTSIKNIEQKFTPRLQRYPLSGQLSQQKSNKKKSESQIQSIQKSHQNIRNKQLHAQHMRTLQQSPDQQQQCHGNSINEQDTSYDYSSQSPYKDSQYMHQQSSSIGYSNNEIGFHNELVANLHMTNTILQQKLKIKQREIQELNRHYFQVKTELIQVKNSQQKKRSSQMYFKTNETLMQKDKKSFKSKPPAYKHHPKYLTNFDLQIVHSIETTQNNSSKVLNNREQQNNTSLPSPRFCDGIQEEFSRQRSIDDHKQVHVYDQAYGIKASHQGLNNAETFNKKRQLFQSSLSQQVSEQFDSQEIYYGNKYDPLNQNRYSFKKSHFYQSQIKNHPKDQYKRDSLVYTLNDDLSVNQSRHKQIHPSLFNSSEKKHSSHIPTQQMLLDSGTDRGIQTMQSSSDDERIRNLSPIKSNDQQKLQNASYRYMKYRNFLSKTQNIIFEDSFNKFDHYLTPQKDQCHKQFQQQIKPLQQGLFQKAFSTIRKTKNQKYIQNSSQNHIQSNQNEMIDSIIEQNRY